MSLGPTALFNLSQGSLDSAHSATAQWPLEGAVDPCSEPLMAPVGEAGLRDRVLAVSLHQGDYLVDQRCADLNFPLNWCRCVLTAGAGNLALPGAKASLGACVWWECDGASVSSLESASQVQSTEHGLLGKQRSSAEGHLPQPCLAQLSTARSP